LTPEEIRWWNEATTTLYAGRTGKEHGLAVSLRKSLEEINRLRSVTEIATRIRDRLPQGPDAFLVGELNTAVWAYEAARADEGLEMPEKERQR
jgi:hypothetical protein